MNEQNNLLNVTLKCGITINFKRGLDKKYNYDGTFSYILMYTFSEYSDVREAAIREIENRAIECAHKALAGLNQRAMMADEAVRLLMEKLLKYITKYEIRKEVEFGCTIYSIINKETGVRINYYSNKEEAGMFLVRQILLKK